MSRGKGTLRAVLDATGMIVLCGRCGTRIASIVEVHVGSANVAGWEELALISEAMWPGSVTRTGQQALPRYHPRRVRFDPGWTPNKQGVWVLPRRELERPGGTSPWRHSTSSRGEPHQLPTLAQCAECDSRQTLNASDLRASDRPPHPSGDYRYVKVAP